jgi:starch synthase
MRMVFDPMRRLASKYPRLLAALYPALVGARDASLKTKARIRSMWLFNGRGLYLVHQFVRQRSLSWNRLRNFVRRKFSNHRNLLAARGRVRIMHLAANKRAKAIGTNARGRQVVMLVVSDLRIDPRVEREARALAGADYQVQILCPEPFEGGADQVKLDWGPNVKIGFLHCSAASFMNGYPGYLADQIFYAAIKFRPLAIHSHDLSTAYVGLAAAKKTGAHLVVDFHEWFSENVHWDSANLQWVPYPQDWKHQLQKLEAQCLTEASATITVCDSIADAMVRELGGRRPHLIRNIPSLSAVPTKEYPPLKQQLGLPKSCFVVLWQGGTGPTRMIEPIIEALVHAPGCTFVIRGPSLDIFGDGYMELARRLDVEDRLILLPPIPSRDVVAAARGADAGIWTLPPLCRNFTYALPNKIFEYLAADLPVLAANYSEPVRLLDQYSVGLTFDPHDPQSIADAINRLIDEPELGASFRANTRTALKDLDAEREWQKLVDVYDGLVRT